MLCGFGFLEVMNYDIVNLIRHVPEIYYVELVSPVRLQLIYHHYTLYDIQTAQGHVQNKEVETHHMSMINN